MRGCGVPHLLRQRRILSCAPCWLEIAIFWQLAGLEPSNSALATVASILMEKSSNHDLPPARHEVSLTAHFV
jgi:hypothetical protein